MNEKFEEHVINEYSEIRKVLESLAEESEEPEAGPSTSSSSDLGDQDKGVKEDVVENKAIVHTIRSLDDLPILTVEYILAQLGLADVMKMRLVSSKWNEVALRKLLSCLFGKALLIFIVQADYIKKVENSFYPNLEKQHIQWVKVNEDVEDYMVPISSTPTAGCSHKRSRSVPRMSSRYHHSSCFINGEMYIFGGFTPSYTCFNDLWRFNYTTKTWRRIIAEGDLPLPRAYFSLNGYEQVNATTGETKYYLILFGGVLTDSSLAMSSRLLSTIHLFDIKENRWRLVNQQPEQQQRLQRNPHQIPLRPIIKAAGHKSIILGDEMIVANGCRMWEEIEVQHGYIAVFNLRTRLWTLQLSRGLSTPMAHFSHARYFRMFYETPMPFPAGFKINNHNILFLYSPWDDASKEAFLLQRKYCRTANCPLCQEQATKDNKPGCSRNNSDGEPRWTWHRCSFNDIENSDNAMRASGEMCQVRVNQRCCLHNLKLIFSIRIDWRSHRLHIAQVGQTKASDHVGEPHFETSARCSARRRSFDRSAHGAADASTRSLQEPVPREDAQLVSASGQ